MHPTFSCCWLYIAKKLYYKLLVLKSSVLKDFQLQDLTKILENFVKYLYMVRIGN